MSLLSLPPELLALLPLHLHNIEDFMNLSSTCTTLHTILSSTKPPIILRLAAASSPTFFRPDPWYLVAATAHQISEWALENKTNEAQFQEALTGGVEALYNLCIENCGITMQKIREMHLRRFDLINPTADFIDKLAGAQWYATPNFWEGGVSDAVTIDCEPTRALFQIIVYGELFQPTFTSILKPELKLPKFDLQTRFNYIRYCIPDWIFVWGKDVPKHLLTGPYSKKKKNTLAGDERAMDFLINCRRWRERWQYGVRHQIGYDFEEEWKQDMWISIVQCQGLEGLEMLRPGGMDKWRDRLLEIRKGIEELEVQPEEFWFDLTSNRFARVWEFPMLARELPIILDRYWPE